MRINKESKMSNELRNEFERHGEQELLIPKVEDVRVVGCAEANTILYEIERSHLTFDNEVALDRRMTDFNMQNLEIFEKSYDVFAISHLSVHNFVTELLKSGARLDQMNERVNEAIVRDSVRVLNSFKSLYENTKIELLQKFKEQTLVFDDVKDSLDCKYIEKDKLFFEGLFTGETIWIDSPANAKKNDIEGDYYYDSLVVVFDSIPNSFPIPLLAEVLNTTCDDLYDLCVESGVKTISQSEYMERFDIFLKISEIKY